MLSFRSFFGLTLSVIIHGSLGAYFLTESKKIEPPKPKKIPMEMAMFKIAPAPALVKVVEPPLEPITKSPEPKKKLPIKTVVTKKPVAKAIPKPPIKLKPKVKKQVQKKKPKKKKPIIKKQVVKKKPISKPPKKAQPKRQAIVQTRPQKKPRAHAPVRKVQTPSKAYKKVSVQKQTRPKPKKPAKKVVKKPSTPRPTTQPVAANNPQLERQYQQRIRQRIEQKKIYPRRAKRRNIQGIVHVAFSINKSGVASKLRIVKSSGSKVLDKAALEAIKNVGRFPAIPAGIRKQFLDYIIPISYRLR